MQAATWPAPVGTLRVGTFGGVSAFPLLVAERLGIATRHGLAVTTTRTTDSASLRDGLLGGGLDVAHAAPDNAIAWADAASADARHEPTSVAVWLAGSNGPIALVAREATDIAGLRGARVGVDSPTSGFAPILVRLLARAGLGTDDVELVALGATRARSAALLEGHIDASMLTLPWSALAVAAGHRLLADHTSVAPRMATSAGIVRRDWLATHGRLASGYRETWADALAWLRDPGSRATAGAWLAEDLGIEAGVADRVLGAMSDPVAGWPLSPLPDAQALDQTAALRAAAGLPPARPAPAYLVMP